MPTPKRPAWVELVLHVLDRHARGYRTDTELGRASWDAVMGARDKILMLGAPTLAQVRDMLRRIHRDDA